MVLHPTIDRRTVLETLGAAGALGSIATATATASEQDRDELRLFGEQAVNNAMEVVTRGNYAYVATGGGLGIVDWKNPGDPALVADIEASDPGDTGGDDEGEIGGILDAKVEDDLVVLAHNGGTGITTVDVGDPENPEELAFYENVDATSVHNCFVYDDHAFLTVNAGRWFEDEEGLGYRIFGDAGVEIVDVSDPTSPEQASLWRLREEFESFANAGTNPNHDVFVQDDLLYNAFWNAGVVVHDVSDPSDPEVVGQFGDASFADEEIRPWRPEAEDWTEYVEEVWPLERYYAGEGNAHYVEPTPDGNHALVGDEKFPNRLEEDPPAETFGGVRIFDTSDLDDAEQVGFVAPPEGDRLRTAHNFRVTQERLHSSWYHGGVRVHDITDRSRPEELGRYRPEGIAFWTAVHGRGFTVGGVYGARSDDHDGGVVFLRDDRGERRPPSFGGSDPQDDPGIGIEPDRA